MHLNVIPLFLVLLILLGVLSSNQSITISATVLLLMQQTVLARYIPLAEQYGVQAGIIRRCWWACWWPGWPDAACR